MIYKLGGGSNRTAAFYYSTIISFKKSCKYAHNMNSVLTAWHIKQIFFVFKINFDIINAMDILGKIVTIIYLLRFVLLQRGIVIGGYVDEFQMADVGSARIRIACSPIIFFLMFKSFHNLLIAKKKIDVVWLVLTILCMVLMTFRTIFVVVGISFIIILFRANLPAEKKVISAILISIICSGVFMNDKVSERITNRFEESAGQDFSNKDYIRVIQYEYFIFSYTKKRSSSYLRG